MSAVFVLTVRGTKHLEYTVCGSHLFRASTPALIHNHTVTSVLSFPNALTNTQAHTNTTVPDALSPFLLFF